jgi:hypothetical protein
MNSADLIRMELNSKMKMEQAQTNIKEGVVPRMNEKEQKRKVHSELEKQKVTKEDVVSNVMRAEPEQSMLWVPAVPSDHKTMHDALREITEHSRLHTDPVPHEESDTKQHHERLH